MPSRLLIFYFSAKRLQRLDKTLNNGVIISHLKLKMKKEVFICFLKPFKVIYLHLKRGKLKKILLSYNRLPLGIQTVQERFHLKKYSENCVS